MKELVFEIRSNDSNAATVRANAIHCIETTETDFRVIAEPIEETRRDAQNRLMWLWNGQIGNELGHSPDYVHGETKLIVGVPMWLANEKLYKRTAFVCEVLSRVVEYRHKVAVAYDMLRTKNLSVKLFAEYLNAVDMHYAEKGLALLSPDELAVVALGDKFYRKTA